VNAAEVVVERDGDGVCVCVWGPLVRPFSSFPPKRGRLACSGGKFNVGKIAKYHHMGFILKTHHWGFSLFEKKTTSSPFNSYKKNMGGIF
jgi:hypothetical protein